MWDGGGRTPCTPAGRPFDLQRKFLRVFSSTATLSSVEMSRRRVRRNELAQLEYEWRWFLYFRAFRSVHPVLLPPAASAQ